jgi:very-short-patch-repair endonuclease
MTLPDGTPAKIDFLWRKERLAIETDGGPFHRTRQSMERDARRDQLLRLIAFEPLRFTDRQVASEPGWVKACLSELIARRQPLASRADGHGSHRAGAQAA